MDWARDRRIHSNWLHALSTFCALKIKIKIKSVANFLFAPPFALKAFCLRHCWACKNRFYSRAIASNRLMFNNNFEDLESKGKKTLSAIQEQQHITATTIIITNFIIAILKEIRLNRIEWAKVNRSMYFRDLLWFRQTNKDELCASISPERL